jgi:hypothetical protein
MDARDQLLLDRYRHHFGGLGLTDEEMLQIIITIRGIAGTLIDETLESVFNTGQSWTKKL